jgi:hypothetical protein
MPQPLNPSIKVDSSKDNGRKKRPSTCTAMTMGVLVFVSSALAGSADAQEINLQRLFTTPEERAAIDARRLSASNQTDAVSSGAMLPLANTDTQEAPEETPLIPENFSIFYHGSFASSDSHKVWINGSIVDPQAFTDVLQMNPLTRDLLVYLGPQQHWVPLKAGQMLYLRRNVVTDRMQEGMEANTQVDTDPMSVVEPGIQQPEFITLLRSQTQ